MLNGNGRLGASSPLDVLTALTGAAQSAATALPQLQTEAQATAQELRTAIKAQVTLSAITAAGTLLLVILALRKK